MLSKEAFLKENNGKNLYVDISLSIALAVNDAAEKLRDGDIDSYSIISWQDLPGMMKSLKSSHNPRFKRSLCFDLKFTKDLPIFLESQTCGF